MLSQVVDCNFNLLFFRVTHDCLLPPSFPLPLSPSSLSLCPWLNSLTPVNILSVQISMWSIQVSVGNGDNCIHLEACYVYSSTGFCRPSSRSFCPLLLFGLLTPDLLQTVGMGPPCPAITVVSFLFSLCCISYFLDLYLILLRHTL